MVDGSDPGVLYLLLITRRYLGMGSVFKYGHTSSARFRARMREHRSRQARGAQERPGTVWDPDLPRVVLSVEVADARGAAHAVGQALCGTAGVATPGYGSDYVMCENELVALSATLGAVRPWLPPRRPPPPACAVAPAPAVSPPTPGASDESDSSDPESECDDDTRTPPCSERHSG